MLEITSDGVQKNSKAIKLNPSEKREGLEQKAEINALINCVFFFVSIVNNSEHRRPGRRKQFVRNFQITPKIVSLGKMKPTKHGLVVKSKPQ